MLNLTGVNLGPPQVTLTTRPHFARKSKRAASQRGYAYENKVGRVLTKIAAELDWTLWTQQWLKEADKYYCPDFVLIAPSNTGIIVEAKLTWRPTEEQRTTYETKLLELGYSCCSITVCKNLKPDTPKHLVVDSFYDIFPGAVWHLWR